MKLYDIKADQVIELEYIATGSGISRIDTLSTAALNNYGYKRVEYTPIPANKDIYKEIKEVGVLKGDFYEVSYMVVDKSQQEISAIKYDEWKKTRAAKVAKIEIVIDNCKLADGSGALNGVSFQGDEDSQNRLSRALAMASLSGLTSTLWVSTDNKTYDISVAQIGEILLKAGLAQTALWNENRPPEVTLEDAQ
ncbi:hypothetical protein A9K75_08865 [Campylobacter fetus subsp. testudinum]|uniref:DUF4376 domain-containing protein n=1 Tax=Campylobacter fetus TaxID=196 RepID=UPI0008188FC5|nr:hypothetical protein [Campylobacter fetus]OCR99010.1 hypothetical protein A9K75_08865 [Campylobacter fetus subsp. testudinum]